MALKGQLLGLVNQGHYQFQLKIGIYDDALPARPFLYPEEEDEGAIPLDKNLMTVECRIDFSDAEKPLSYPMDELIPCMEVYEKYETPDGLNDEDDRLWRVAFIVDTIIGEIFATDILEVIHGDEFEDAAAQAQVQEQKAVTEAATAAPVTPAAPPVALETKAPQTEPGIRCPDCGAAVRTTVNTPKGKNHNYSCEVCGRFFET